MGPASLARNFNGQIDMSIMWTSISYVKRVKF